MKNRNQKPPGKPVIGNHGNQIAHGGDHGAGSDGGIDFELFEKNGNNRSRNARKKHGAHERNARASGNGKRKSGRLCLENSQIRANEYKRQDSKDEAV